MLTVFNVGQADAIELIPVTGCKFAGSSILVDCGNGTHDVFSKLHSNNVILALSHSHSDHIGGLSSLFGGGATTRVGRLWIPYYSDEIVKIANFILSLKGVKQIVGRTPSGMRIMNMISAHRIISNLLSTVGCQTIEGLKEGDRLCDHLSVLNPPLDPDAALGLPHGKCEKYWKSQMETDYGDIKQWLYEEDFHSLWGSFIAEGWERTIPDLVGSDVLDRESRMRFIYGFFSRYRRTINEYVANQTTRKFKNIVNAINLSANDLSIVLRYEARENGFSCLLTGDIGKERLRDCLHNSGNRPTKIFKYPHHGSKNSLDSNVLKTLSPELTIISHDNGVFGRRQDPHPNIEVINALEKLKLSTAYTNDVIKNGKTFRNKASSKPHQFVEIVEMN